MALIVYVLCAATSLACSALLLRNYGRTRQRLLLWSALCFAGLSLNNMLLITDTAILPAVDLGVVRMLPALAGVALLVFGLVWESRA
jgi:hypothetical protein